MAIPTPPQPENLSSTANTTNTTRPIYPRPSHTFYSPSQSRLPSNPNPNYPQLAPRPPQVHHPHDPSQYHYPIPSSGIASTGRGYVSRPVPRSNQRPPMMFPHPDQGNQGFVRPNQLMPLMVLGSGPAPAGVVGVIPGMAKGVPISSSQHPKAGPLPAPVFDSNGHKDLRDRSRDDSLTVIKGRKVRMQDNLSLYALCRSWLRNGFPEDTQPQYQDAVKSLPRPLPVAAKSVDSPNKKEKDKENEDEGEASVEDLSPKELLQIHTKRAKRVRARLREERLERITRYKARLTLLLPPTVDQHFKNEANYKVDIQ